MFRSPEEDLGGDRKNELVFKTRHLAGALRAIEHFEQERDELHKELAQIYKSMIGQVVEIGGWAEFAIHPEFGWESYQRDIPVKGWKIEGVEEHDNEDQEAFVIVSDPDGDNEQERPVMEILSIEVPKQG